MMRVVLSVFLLFGTTAIIQWDNVGFVSSFVVPLCFRSPIRFRDHRGWSVHSLGSTSASTTHNHSTLEERTPVNREQDGGRSNQMITTNAKKWEDMFALLAQYKEREANCNVPQGHQEDGKNLGTWLNTQRQNKKKGTLDSDLEDRLTSLGVIWDLFAQQWEDMFALLVEYKEREGNCNVPNGHQEDGKNLGRWLTVQRQSKKKGAVDSDLEDRLTSLGVVWDPFAQQWEDMFALLVKYKEREGDCNVPNGHQEDGQNLRTWLQNQRQNKKKGALDIDLEARLTSLGVVWDNAQKWEDMFALLVKYKEREGDCNVPYSSKEDGENLGTWLATQRTNMKKGVLDGNYEGRLASLGVVWKVFGQQWEDMFALLVKYKEREGNCNVPKMHQEDGENLGRWIHNQRQNKKSGRLSADREARLTSLGVVWDNAQKWEDKFALLVKYKEREGDCNVPWGHQEDGIKLGRWLDNQRQNKKNGRLSADREGKLCTLGVVWEFR